MSEYREARLLQIHEETRKALSTTIRVGYEQVLQIVVSDLIRKYKYLISIKDPMKDQFRLVLLYYITQDELDKFYQNPELIYED